MIRLTITGSLGGDAEVRHLDNGRSAISFSVAHSERWKDAQGQQQERTTWVRCTIWRKSDQIGVAQYLLKGTKVLVEGAPSARAWANQQGEPQASLELNVKELEFMGSKNAAPAQNTAQNTNSIANQEGLGRTPAAPAPIFTGNVDDDSLPF